MTESRARLHLLGGCRLENPDAASAVLIQSKRLALLGYLATSHATPPTRERLCALFWPELDDQAARHSLRQSLYHIRGLLGPNAIASRGKTLTLASDAVWCDVHVFERLLKEGRFSDAVSAYRGDLFDGFHVDGAAPEFEQWLETRRTTLRSAAVAAALSAAMVLDAANDAVAAERFVHWAESLAPLDERVLRQRLELLERAGNRGAALEAFAQFADRLRAQLEIEPSAETVALIRRIGRERGGTVAAPNSGRPVVPRTPSAAPFSNVPTIPFTRTTDRRWTRYVVGPALLSGIALVFWMIARPFTAQHAASEPRRIAAIPVPQLLSEGVRAYCAQQIDVASQLFQSALKADSSSAMALYYQSLVDAQRDQTSARVDHLRTAVRLARHGPDRERLLISAEWAALRNDTSWRVVAETLAVRYADSHDGDLTFGRALLWAGDFARARSLLLRAAQRPIRPEHAGPPTCRPSDAYADVVSADFLLDSLSAAERDMRAWLRVDSSALTRGRLADVFERQERYQDALHTRQASFRPVSEGVDDRPYRAMLAIRAGDLSQADRLLSERATDARREVRESALWWLTTLRREQGRPRAAIEVAQAFRSSIRATEGEESALDAGIQQAQAMLEAGESKDAARLFDSLASRPARGLELVTPRPNGTEARRRAWGLAHVASAVAADGDTTRLAALADTLRRAGSLSAFGRDRRVFHHARGELLLARSDTAAALRELQTAIFSVSDGYTRTNLLMGQVLTRLGRGREAVAILLPSLRGSMEGSNLYVTRTEIAEALGDAYASFGDWTAARPYYRRVAAAWSDGEPAFSARARRALALSQ
ncbi:MAG: BTAD domain-containing putative transcriptional regulator [Gemmatimonadaceae bacterium]